MALYRYEAIDKTGKVVRGVMDAASEQSVTQKLGAMGYSARSIYGTGQTHSTQTVNAQSPPPNVQQPNASVRRSGGMQSVTLASGVPVSIKSCVPASQLASFFRQLATLVKSGQPLFQSSTSLIVRNDKLKAVLPHIQEHVQSGKKLSGAMADYPGVFPVHTVASIWCGELAGKLDVALEEIATDFELEASEIRFARIGRFLSKASLLSLVFALPMSNLTSLLLPAFNKTLEVPDADWKQTLMFILQNYMQTMFWKSVFLCSVVIASWIAFGYVKRNPAAKRLIDALVLRVPVWGALQRYRALARFTHVLDGLYAAGIPPTTAWDAASLTVRNSALAEKLKTTSNANVGVVGVANLCAASKVFDLDDVGLVSAGERSGQVPDVLSNLSCTYADKAQSQRTAARSLSVSLLILFSIILTGYIMIRMVGSYVDLAFKAAEAVGR